MRMLWLHISESMSSNGIKAANTSFGKRNFFDLILLNLVELDI